MAWIGTQVSCVYGSSSYRQRREVGPRSNLACLALAKELTAAKAFVVSFSGPFDFRS